jgi:hypothetical protein
VDINPQFKRLKSKELDQLGFDVAALRQLTHNNLVAKQAVADAKSSNMTTYACYITICLHARKVAETLEHATISFNLRQGQANSPDLTVFATEVVHDPTDCTFLGGVYTRCSTHSTHGVGIRGESRYMHTQTPGNPSPSGPFLVNTTPNISKIVPPSPPKYVSSQPTQYGAPKPQHLRRPELGPFKAYPVPPPTPCPMPVYNKETNVALPYTAKPPLRGKAQSQSDTARKTHLGPRLCIWCDVYGHTYTQCKLKYSVPPTTSLPSTPSKESRGNRRRLVE